MKLRFIPLVIFFAILVLGTRITTLFTHLGSKNILQEAKAQIAPEKDTQNTPLMELDTVAPPPKKKAMGPIDKFDPFNMTAEQYQALRKIVNERDRLAGRERSISEKEQVLQALVQKMDVKIQELNKSKTELKNLLNTIDEKENANITRLVKIAEAMKAPQAAKVLEGIEFPILLEIKEKMKEKKASAILAVMPPDKAGYLMTALSKRRKIFKKSNPSKGIMQG